MSILKECFKDIDNIFRTILLQKPINRKVWVAYLVRFQNQAKNWTTVYCVTSHFLWQMEGTNTWQLDSNITQKSRKLETNLHSITKAVLANLKMIKKLSKR